MAFWTIFSASMTVVAFVAGAVFAGYVLFGLTAWFFRTLVLFTRAVRDGWREGGEHHAAKSQSPQTAISVSSPLTVVCRQK